MKGESNPAYILVIIFIVFVAFLLIKEFSNIDPSFSGYGWLIFGALVTGVIIFLRSGGAFK